MCFQRVAWGTWITGHGDVRGERMRKDSPAVLVLQGAGPHAVVLGGLPTTATSWWRAKQKQNLSSKRGSLLLLFADNSHWRGTQ